MTYNKTDKIPHSQPGPLHGSSSPLSMLWASEGC